MTSPAPAELGPDMGWHVDPWQRHQLRFHDGQQWTEHVADGGFPGLDTTPVADMPRSRPRPVEDAPPPGQGPRVLPDERRGATSGPGSLDDPLLLLDEQADGRRTLLDPDDRVAGRIERLRPSWPRRALGLLAAAPSEAPTRMVVTDAEGVERLRLSRPSRRIAPVVDLAGPDGLSATVRAQAVRQGLRAELHVGSEVVAHVVQAGTRRAELQVVDAEGTSLARLAAVWDIPGGRRHLPPGVLLVDRRSSGSAPDPGRGLLLLGALLAVELLVPPPPPPS